MARARNIKPGFFTNDVLAELPPLARLLFAGLWTLCDRSGRAEDRPKRIKAEVLAYDDCDCDALLQMLHDKGFIRRYEAGGTRLIQVLTWEKHQNPHVKEAASSFPAPDEHSTSTRQEQCSAQPLPERAGLIPDSLIPDSGFSDSAAPAVATGAAKSQRPSRKCPSSFEPQDPQAWIDANCPGLDWQRETEKFRDHTFKTARTDWLGTWRNWMRGAFDDRPKGRSPPTSFHAQDMAAKRAVANAWMGSCAPADGAFDDIEMGVSNARIEMG